VSEKTDSIENSREKRERSERTFEKKMSPDTTIIQEPAKCKRKIPLTGAMRPNLYEGRRAEPQDPAVYPIYRQNEQKPGKNFVEKGEKS